MSFFSVGGKIIEPERIARAAAENDMIIVRGDNSQYADLRQILGDKLGSKSVRELYKDEEAGVYLLGLE